MADDRARFTGMLPGTLLDPNSPGNDRFPVTIGDCNPMSGVDKPDDWYVNPENPVNGCYCMNYLSIAKTNSPQSSTSIQITRSKESDKHTSGP